MGIYKNNYRWLWLLFIIIGGRYGSVTVDGISYTEKEFDYAIESGLKIIALIHGKPDNIPFGKTEVDSNSREKLIQFKDKVMTGRLVKFWETAKELNQTRKEFKELAQKYSQITALKINKPYDIADIDNSFIIHGKYQYLSSTNKYYTKKWKISLTWKDISSLIAPYLLEQPNNNSVKETLTNSLIEKQNLDECLHSIMDQVVLKKRNMASKIY